MDFSIGSLYTPHDGFDTIVHLAYINPYFNRGLQHREYRVCGNVHEFGLYDTDSDADYLQEVVHAIIPKLSGKILFKCQSGKSRSVSVALACLCLVDKISIEEGLAIIREKRPEANPRDAFLRVVERIIDSR